MLMHGSYKSPFLYMLKASPGSLSTEYARPSGGVIEVAYQRPFFLIRIVRGGHIKSIRNPTSTDSRPIDPDHSLTAMASISAKWTRIHEAETLQRSSQILSVVDNRAYVFGGELRPREPRDNDIHVLSVNEGKQSSHIPGTA